MKSARGTKIPGSRQTNDAIRKTRWFLNRERVKIAKIREDIS